MADELTAQIDDKTSENEHLRDLLIDSYKQQIHKLGQLIEALRLSSDIEEKSALGKKIKELTHDISNPDTQKELEVRLNSEINNIVQHLRDDFPTLKEKDFLFLSYMIIGFDATQIAILLNMSIGSVYTKRFRLREKISSYTGPYQDQYRRWIL